MNGLSPSLRPFLTEPVRKVLFSEHPSLPRGDLWNQGRQQPQRIVRGHHGHPEHVTHGDKHEKVFHARP